MTRMLVDGPRAIRPIVVGVLVYVALIAILLPSGRRTLPNMNAIESV